MELKLANKPQEQTVENQAPQTPFIDRSELLFNQMNFIAMNNKSFINIRK